MSLRTKTREQLYQRHSYRRGRVEAAALRGFMYTVEKVQGHGVKVPDLQISTFSAQTSTEADVDAAGTGRLYFVWASSLAGAANDVIIQLKDNDIVIGSFKLKAAGATATEDRASEVYFFDSVDGVGLEYATDLEVQAVAAVDGTSNPAAADRPDIVVVWGDDAINTDDANLINVNFG